MTKPLAVVLLALAIAACGGGNKASTTPAPDRNSAGLGGAAYGGQAYGGKPPAAANPRHSQ